MNVRFPWLRGAAVFLTWVLWPPLALMANVVLMLLQNAGCPDGCKDTDAGFFFFLFLLGPPIFVTIKWWRWRRDRDDE